MKVIDLLVLGKCDQDIADALGISYESARFQVRRILKNLDADNRTQAVAKILAPHLFKKEK